MSVLFVFLINQTMTVIYSRLSECLLISSSLSAVIQRQRSVMPSIGWNWYRVLASSRRRSVFTTDAAMRQRSKFTRGAVVGELAVEPGQGGAVGVPGDGVRGEVLADAKLRRVDVEADDDVVVVAGGGADEGQVAVVQGAHGRHEGDGAGV